MKTRVLNMFNVSAKGVLLGSFSLALLGLTTQPVIADTLLQVEGELSEADALLYDDTYYDDYVFEGVAGQTVAVLLESAVFDTYLFLLDENETILTENDDLSVRSRDSFLFFTLPRDGQYRVRANAYDSSNRGPYQLTVTTGNTALISNEAMTRRQQAHEQINVGDADIAAGRYEAAIEALTVALANLLTIDDPIDTVYTLSRLADVHHELGQSEQAQQYLDQGFALAAPLENDHLTFQLNYAQSTLYEDFDEHQQALPLNQQNLEIANRLDNDYWRALASINIANTYHDLGEYALSVEYFQSAIALTQRLDNAALEASAQTNVGLLYHDLGQFDAAIASFERAIVLAQTSEQLEVELIATGGLGLAYYDLDNLPAALAQMQQFVQLTEVFGQPIRIAEALYNLSYVQLQLGQYADALDNAQQAIDILAETGEDARFEQGYAWHTLAEVYRRSGGDAALAFDAYGRSAAIFQEIDNIYGEAWVMSNLGKLASDQSDQDLAIVFLKASVNQREALRASLQALDTTAQQSFVDTFAEDYRLLADLLLEQDRILEAQQVLDLLKVQELEDYLSTVRGNVTTAQGVEYLPAEASILDEFNTLQTSAVTLAQEIQLLNTSDNLTADQQQRLEALEQQQLSMRQDFREFSRSPDIRAYREQLSFDAREQSVSLQSLTGLSDNLAALDQNAVLFYPLILEDRLELILTVPGVSPIRHTVEISRTDLNQLVVDLRSSLRSKNQVDIPATRQLSQQLYDILIRPIEADLQAAGAETIIYSPDGALRYVPLAALNDGDAWLIENYQVNNITALSLTDLNTRPSGEFNILAAAFSDGFYEVQVAERSSRFGGLENAGIEVETLASQFKDSTTAFFNQEFSPDAIVPQLDDHTIVHLATHAEFVTGQPDASYILFGNGDPVTLRDIRNEWFLDDVDLVVLSACETGLGGALGNGDEILGLGYVMQEVGAKAAIASLWQVNDRATQELMVKFYSGLESGLSKNEALREAQVYMIEQGYTNPYFWAPFILIGNGL